MLPFRGQVDAGGERGRAGEHAERAVGVGRLHQAALVGGQAAVVVGDAAADGATQDGADVTAVAGDAQRREEGATRLTQRDALRAGGQAVC